MIESKSGADLRLLFVCDEYPPFDRGGYSQLCYDLAGGLRERGNQVTVLCPQVGGQPEEDETVVRCLRLPIKPGSFPIPIQQVAFAAERRRHNSQILKRVLLETQADAILIWPNLLLDPQLMFQAESEHCLAAYYVAGFSPTQLFLLEQYWSNPGRSKIARLSKTLLRPFLGPRKLPAICLAMKHMMCVSEYERERVIHEGVDGGNVVVIHNGVDLNKFPFLGLPSTRRQSGLPLRVLYSGRLVEDKGAHTIIEALRLLSETDSKAIVQLTLLGSGSDPYVRELNRRVALYGLNSWVKRRDWIHRDHVQGLMANYDVLVIPTTRPEALPRVAQEAMAMGLVVVATPTGGTPEIVHDGLTGLIFAPDDPAELADCLKRLYSDVALCNQLALTALDLVKSEFTIQGMAEKVERQIAKWMREETLSALG